MELKTILENTLRKEPNFLTDKGEVKKWVVINKAQNYDETLLEILLNEPRLKALFFKEIGAATVFNLNLFTDFIEQKAFLPDSYTGFPNKIGLQIGDRFLRQRNEVALVWPYKDCVLEGGQSREEDSRKEIFFNELLAQDEITQLLEPKVITNVQYFGDTKELTPTSNLLIKGNNLLALHSLKKQFTGKVKLIYIDPPYNTGNDGFRYNDSFNHSSWLTFMKNRLEVAKTLLSDDGVLWINLDDGELHYLKILCDEIFRRENFVGSIIWEKSDSPRMDATFFSVRHDSILVYAKNMKFLEFYLEIEDEVPEHYSKTDDKGRSYYLKPLRVMGGNISESLYFPMISPDSTEVYPLENNGSKSCWRWSEKKVNGEKERIEWVNGKKGWNPYFRIYAENRRATPSETIWTHQEVGSNRTSKNEIRNLFGRDDFQTPKPEKLLQRIIQLSTQESDIVLDFHVGSGTTCAVAHKMGRQYIGIEQMDYIETVTVERLKKVIEGEQGGISKTVNWQGGGSFVYLELKKYNEAFVEKIRDAQSTEALLEVWEDMKGRSFMNYNTDLKAQEQAIAELKTHTLEIQKEKLVSILDKNQLYVSLSNMDDAQYGITEEEKAITKAFYES